MIRRLLVGCIIVLGSTALNSLTIDPDRYETMMQLSPSSFQRLDDYRSTMPQKLSGMFVAMDVHAPGSFANPNIQMPFDNSSLALKQAFNANFGTGGIIYGFKRRIFADFGFCYSNSNLLTETPPNMTGTTQSAPDATGRREFYRDISISKIASTESFGYAEIGATDIVKFTAGAFYRTQPITSTDASGKRVFDYGYTSDGTITTSKSVQRNLYGINVLGAQLDSLILQSELSNLRTYYGIPVWAALRLDPW